MIRGIMELDGYTIEWVVNGDTIYAWNLTDTSIEVTQNQLNKISGLSKKLAFVSSKDRSYTST